MARHQGSSPSKEAAASKPVARPGARQKAEEQFNRVVYGPSTLIGEENLISRDRN